MPVIGTTTILGGVQLADVCKTFGIRQPERYAGYVVLLLPADLGAGGGTPVEVKTDAPDAEALWMVLRACAEAMEGKR